MLSKTNKQTKKNIKLTLTAQMIVSPMCMGQSELSVIFVVMGILWFVHFT